MTSQATTATTLPTGAASNTRARAAGKRNLSWIVPTLYIVFLMLPIYWLVNMSFKTNAEITGAFSLWPANPTLRNYTVIFTDPAWYSGYINSILYVVLNTVISSATAGDDARAATTISAAMIDFFMSCVLSFSQLRYSSLYVMYTSPSARSHNTSQ